MICFSKNYGEGVHVGNKSIGYPIFEFFWHFIDKFYIYFRGGGGYYFYPPPPPDTPLGVSPIFTHFFIHRFINRKRLISVNSLTGQKNNVWGANKMVFFWWSWGKICLKNYLFLRTLIFLYLRKAILKMPNVTFLFIGPNTN